MNKKLLILVLLLCIISCKSTRNIHILDLGQNKFISVEDSTFKKLELWRKDSLACLKLRNSELAYELSIELNLKKSTKENIISLLGQPFSFAHTKTLSVYDEEKDSNKLVDGEILQYIVDCICLEGKYPNLKGSYILFEIFINKETGEVVNFGCFNAL